MWDAATGAELATLRGHGGNGKRERDVWSCAFARDGATVATASSDETARLWDAASGRELRVFAGHANRVTAVAFAPDGRRVATASWDGLGRVWCVATGDVVALRGHAAPAGTNAATHARLEGCDFAPDGRRVVTASWDRTARLWDAVTGAALAVLRGHSETVYCCAFSPDGTRVATGAEDRTARVWDV